MFKKGDRVWCFIFKKWGTVVNIGTSWACVEVKFDDGCEENYTKTGQIIGAKCRVLFFGEIQLPTTATERPRKKALDMLNECKKKDFIHGDSNFYIYYNHQTKKIKISRNEDIEHVGVKYISFEDAVNIVENCKENN